MGLGAGVRVRLGVRVRVGVRVRACGLRLRQGKVVDRHMSHLHHEVAVVVKG